MKILHLEFWFSLLFDYYFFRQVKLFYDSSHWLYRVGRVNLYTFVSKYSTWVVKISAPHRVNQMIFGSCLEKNRNELVLWSLTKKLISRNFCWGVSAIISKMCKFRKKIPWYQLFFTIVFTLHKFDKELVRVCRAAPLSFFFITFFSLQMVQFFFLICRHICVSYLKVSAQLIGEKKKSQRH